MKTQPDYSKKYAYIDFEYNDTTEKDVNVVCCSISTNTSDCIEFWEDDKKELIDYIHALIEDDYIFMSWSVVAEARSFLALGIDPIKVKWFDLFLEYRCLMNHSDLQFGRQLIDGKIHRNPHYRFDPKFKKPEENLAAACFKLLDVKIDTDHKEYMRDIIIDGRYIEEHKKAIMDYCTSDIKYLPQLFEKMVKLYVKRLPKKELATLKEEMLRRGEYAARTAKMESIGYPINYEATKQFSRSVQDILNDIAEDINRQFPGILPFERNKASRKYVFKQAKAKKEIERWCKENNVDSWPRSEKTGEYSLSVDAYSKFFQFRHDFPEYNYFAQVLRYKKTEQHMNGFKPKAKPSNYWPGTTILKNKDPSNKRRKNFFHSVGRDKRVRPYLNIYGAQSARSQPSATGFIPLKAAWMRSLIQPPKGKCIIGIDYGQQEFFVKGIISRDKNMQKAYASGDVYLYFGKSTGEIPHDASKKHPLRDKFKSTTLGIQFGMSKFGLSIKLTNDTGTVFDEDQAQELIDDFNNLYEDSYEWTQELLDNYENDEYIKLPCGWYMWGENPNKRSTGNMPIQGFGSSIMRKAVALAQDSGLDVIYTLHDALYVECNIGDKDENIKKLAECMDKAFRYYFDESIKDRCNIRLDADVWSNDFNDGESNYSLDYCEKFTLPVKQQQIYIDPRSTSEYERFKKYFVDRFSIHLL